jgi:hypothetical protein
MSTNRSTTASLDGVNLTELADGLVDEMGADLVTGIERYLAARRRTAHPLVTATTQELVDQALAAGPLPAPTTGSATDVSLPRGLWRVMPDRLLSLHPARRGEGVQRLRITTAQHLELTALVLERWGWARTPKGWRTPGGSRCILGAQAAIFHLGYGTEDTVTAAGIHIQTALTRRGIREPYPTWNDRPGTSRDQVLAVIRTAATAARR